MPKVCLISPPELPLHEHTHAPLGIMYVGATLERAGHEVKLVDLSRAEEKDWLGRIPSGYDIYGFSATTPQFNYCRRIVAALKSRDPQAYFIVGGPHATILPREALQTSRFDVAVIGEGEETLCDFAEQGFSTRGIAYKKAGIYFTPPRQEIQDLDSLPFPARYLLPFNSIFSDRLVDSYNGSGRVFAGSIIFSRGCPYSCAYCVKNWSLRVRFRSPRNIYDELYILKNTYGINHFRAVDDNININRKWLLEVCKEIAPLEMFWRAHTRANLADEETFKAMYEAGCRELSFGIESGNDKILKFVNKGITVEQAKNAIELAKKYFKIRIYLIHGLPSENRESINETKKFLLETKPDFCTYSQFIPFPGSPIYNNPEAYGIKILNSNSYETWWQLGGLRDISSIVYEPLWGVSKEDLFNWRNEMLDWLCDNGLRNLELDKSEKFV